MVSQSRVLDKRFVFKIIIHAVPCCDTCMTHCFLCTILRSFISVDHQCPQNAKALVQNIFPPQTINRN